MKFITIYVTHKNKNEAENKFIACVNYFPIKVSYHWRWKIANENEVVSLLKTRIENWEKVRQYIEKNHPYKTPCIMKNEVEANEDYVEWVNEVTE